MTNGNLSVNGRKARDCRAVTAQSLEFFFRTWTETKWHLGQNAGLKAMGRSIKFSVWFAEVTLMTSNPLLNTFINFHSACLTKKGLMNFLSMVSFFLSLCWKDALTCVKGCVGVLSMSSFSQNFLSIKAASPWLGKPSLDHSKPKLTINLALKLTKDFCWYSQPYSNFKIHIQKNTYENALL